MRSPCIIYEAKDVNIKDYTVDFGVDYHAIDYDPDIPYIPFPVRLSTVDGIIMTASPDGGRVEILLVRKPTETRWRFPGGFVDPGETTSEAAKREMKEEVNLTFDLEPYPLFETAIDDERYRDSPHKIVTTVYLFDVSYIGTDMLKPQDDVCEIKWIDFKSLDRFFDFLVPCHWVIASKFLLKKYKV